MNNENVFIDDLEQMKGVRGCVQLYSSRLDSRYFLQVAREIGIRVLALRVLVGSEDQTEVNASAKGARLAGAEYIEIDARHSFVDDFVSNAIVFNARYGNVYPICSSLSRPLIAMKAVELASGGLYLCLVARRACRFWVPPCPCSSARDEGRDANEG